MSKQNEVLLDHTGYVGHGSTPAAWACVAILTVGVIIAVVGFTIEVMVMLWVGLALCGIGLVVGFVMKKMGMGYEGEVARAASDGARAH